ncbi:type II toxin-antitoxin system PemK/MazF family toxin [Mycolicibacterium sp. CR10]|uniref:type II toxin-antitoxin system PemK/MazF family toxin n=1 Tax=Mycolicibacterium sp. CR10 TaxID=2562314 RepID=UPI0010C00EE9|nr:type II toxin-antitoxin system PemK/MazF family toxin [Mycolicibacterium sp. CR10]
MTAAVRGQIYHIDLGGERGPHYYVVISNNRRNRNLKSVLGCMITSTDKSHIPTAVRLSHEDSFTGSHILADTIDELWEDEVAGPPAGYVSTRTMAALGEALKIALALT